MSQDTPARPGHPRRTFLRLAVLAPVAVAGCATAASARKGGAPAPEGGAASPGAAAQPSAADALRAVPLAMDVEPAFVFRARGGE